MSWKDLAIRWKIIVVGTFFIALTMFIGLYWISDIKSSGEAIRTLFEDRVTPLTNLSRLAEGGLRIRSMELQASSSFSEEVIKRIRRSADRLAVSMDEVWSGYTSTNLSGDERELADAFKFAWDRYRLLAKKSYEYAIEGLEDDAIVNVKSKSGPKFEGAISTLDSIIEFQRENSRNIYNDSRAKIKSSLKTAIILIVLGTVLATLLLLALYTSIVTPIRQMVNILKDIAKGEGDLRSRINVQSKGELGELAHWFNQFVEKLQGIMKEVVRSSENMAKEVESLKLTSTHMIGGVNNQSKSTQSIAASIEEMSASIAQVASSSSDASNLATEAVDTAASGNEVVEKTLRGMEQISLETHNSSEIIARLGRSSGSIDNIVLVIEDIADQTNLLALNAAIEAARAGEHGRGFAVVSDEVRKLAEKTIKATKEISQVIGNIHSDTSAAVKSMDTGKNEVERGVALTNQSGDALQMILDKINIVQEQIAQIATAMEEQSLTAENISREIEGITEEGGGVLKDADSVNRAIQNLVKVSQDLKTAVGSFTL